MNDVFLKDFAILRELYKECNDLVKQVILFGSLTEGSWNEKSDVDILFVAGKNQITDLNNRFGKVCSSRGLIIGRDIVVEDLQGYNRFYPEMIHRLHLLKTEVPVLDSNEPIVKSVKRGRDITEELNG